MNFRSAVYQILMIIVSFSWTYAQQPSAGFEKEKAYVQTSHVFFKPGETMDFRIYVVNAYDNLPAKLSKVVNFEMADPSGSVITKLKYELRNGHAEGSVYFDADMKGGIYKIKAYTSWMQNEKGKNFFEKEITLQKNVSPRILMKLDFPRKGYGAGDEVLADFSMRSLSNLPIPFYEAGYTVMIDGEKVSGGKFLTDNEGKSLLKFKLPDRLQSTDALLTINVDFDGFKESVSRNIPVVLHRIEVKFMPEGGTFVNGIPQNIAFRISDEFEKPVDASLEIFNRKHEKISEATAYQFGMGNFTLKPEEGDAYYAKIVKPEHISQIYHLPVAENGGLVLNIGKESGKVRLKIVAGTEKKIAVDGSFRGKQIYNRQLVLEKGENYLEIDEKELPAGICRFTISENGIPVAERVVFVNEDVQMKVKVEPSKKNYLPREKVILDIETNDENGKPVPASLALSVIDDKLWTYADDKQNHLISWLLMDSELHGKIERPQFYFDKKEAKAKKSLDLVMLTNGYRYFEPDPEILKNGSYKYLPEQRNPVYGMVQDEEGRPVKAEVFLLEETYGTGRIIKQITGEKGAFYFTDLQNSNYKIIARSFQPKKKLEIRILSYKLNISPVEKSGRGTAEADEAITEAIERTETKKADRDIARAGTPSGKMVGRPVVSDTVSREQNINEVIVTGAMGIKREASVTGALTSVRAEEVPELSSLAGKVAGLEVVPSGNQVNGYVTIRGSRSISGKSPLFVVDGIPVEHFNDRINPQDISSVTVLKDAAATAVYGSQGVNGVILVTSARYGNSGHTMDITPKTYFAVKAVSRDSLESYARARKFSYPVYETTRTPYRFDYREILYWNPVVETGKNGKARVEFYNSDATTTFRTLTEGISAGGLIGRDETTYATQSMISADAKIPQYLTRTDRMKIPVVIKNNSAETRAVVMDVIVPNRVHLVKADTVISLKPLQSGRMFVEIQADEKVDSNIRFTLSSGNFRETIMLPFTVEEKGFPHRYSITNHKTQEMKISIPDYISGSLISSYHVYSNRALQLFEDMDRLKREPYGCFEQLSSTVYPNIFILDYLKSIHAITPETERLAIRNMKKGYQKMLSYKNGDGGFSYFASSESDVALSAFALLEFRDLKKYVDIDPKIISNLISFIRSKKNRNGIFEVKRSYETSPASSEYQWARNIYVLYALSKMGIQEDLHDAFEVSMKRAMATKDPYQLALMANAAVNFGRTHEYRQLMEILDNQFTGKSWNVKSTFTGSQGSSADSETTALYMMAQQKDKMLSPLEKTAAADRLMNSNGYHGFGSTQATTLALEALSGFFAENEKLYGQEKPAVKINGAQVQPEQSIASAFASGENIISVQYPKDKGLPYQLEYEYYTLKAPENSTVPLVLETTLKSPEPKVGETSRMTVTVKNRINGPLPMVTAKIGIPAGLTLQNALLKDLVEKKQVSYYEIFDNYLVLYWEHFEASETKSVHLDLKAEFAGTYTGKASHVYLYYMPEARAWNEGIRSYVQP